MASLYMDPRLNGTPAWMSGALSVFNQNDQGQNPTRPLLDTPDQFARIRVNNDPPAGDGAATITNVHAQFWIHAFATAAPTSLYLPSAGGVKGVLIPPDVVSPEEVLPGVAFVFEQEWTPTNQELIDGGLRDPQNPAADVHCCMLANVFAPGKGQQIVTSPQPPTSHASWNAATNPLNAQCNMTLVTLATTTARLDFFMFAGNPDPERRQVVRLEVREARRTPELADAEREHLLVKPWIERHERGFGEDAVAGVALVVGGERLPIRLPDRSLDDLHVEAGEQSGPKLELELGADESQPIRLRASLPEEENVLRVLDVVQTGDDATSGGARLLLLTVPEELLEERASGYGSAGS